MHFWYCYYPTIHTFSNQKNTNPLLTHRQHQHHFLFPLTLHRSGLNHCHKFTYTILLATQPWHSIYQWAKLIWATSTGSPLRVYGRPGVWPMAGGGGEASAAAGRTQVKHLPQVTTWDAQHNRRTLHCIPKRFHKWFLPVSIGTYQHIQSYVSFSMEGDAGVGWLVPAARLTDHSIASPPTTRHRRTPTVIDRSSDKTARRLQ